jgi:hypothetical protein
MSKISPASLACSLVWSSAALFAIGACSSNKNHDERAVAQKYPLPDYAAFDNITGGEDTMVQFPVADGCGLGVPEKGCIQDPGSTTTAEELADMQRGLEFAWIWPEAGPGLATYTYDDNTTRFHVPTMVKSMASDQPGGWEPKFYSASFLGPGPTLSARFKGGPFTEYGGGFGQSFRTSTNGSTHPQLPPSAEFPGDANGYNGAYDLTGWTGLAIFVRRGPTGQSTMRIGITERNSAEDLNSGALNESPSVAPGVVEGKYCRRWRVCGCAGGTPCSLYTKTTAGADEFRCFDPELGRPDEATVAADPIAYPTCGTTRCNEANVSTFMPGATGKDPLFNGKSCSYAVQSDGRSDQFCYNPGSDPTPPAKRERCNNPFSRAFNVTTDWQIIKIPFTELRQADEADVANDMDLKSVKQIVVTYGAGWLDFWVANLGFYRSTP